MMAIISAICSVARGSTVGGKQPIAAASSWKPRVVASVSSRMEMPRSAARALIF
jgi:hypothetical protein